MGPAALERRNPNCVGGDINGWAHDATAPSLFLCSPSTPRSGD
jgi:hypothetical protein